MTPSTARTIVLFLLAIFFFISAVLMFPVEKEIPEENFVDRIRETAVPIKTLDWQAIDLADLRFLDEELEGKRIVYLGEPLIWIGSAGLW
jgi:hypothetical protein